MGLCVKTADSINDCSKGVKLLGRRPRMNKTLVRYGFFLRLQDGTKKAKHAFGATVNFIFGAWGCGCGFT